MVVDKTDAKYIKVEYNVDDNIYSRKIENAFKEYKVNDTYKIYYNNKNPKDNFVPNKHFSVYITFFIMASIIFFIFTLDIFKYLKKLFLINTLKKENNKIKAKIIEIINCPKKQIGNIVPVLIIATKNCINYKSEPLYIESIDSNF